MTSGIGRSPLGKTTVPGDLNYPKGINTKQTQKAGREAISQNPLTLRARQDELGFPLRNQITELANEIEIPRLPP